jgi:predicted DNA-binding protein
MAMIKYTLKLPREQIHAIKQIAIEQNKPHSAVSREILQNYLNQIQNSSSTPA